MEFTPRLRFWGWSGVVAVLLGVFVLQVIPHLKFETNILALLPPSEGDHATDVALDRFTDKLGRNVIYLIGDTDFDRAKSIAEAFAKRLGDAPDAFEKVRFKIDANALQDLGAAYVPYRDGLLSDRMRDWLMSGNDQSVIDAARQALYSPAAFMRRSSAGEDPLNLFGDFLARATPATGQFGVHDGLLTSDAPGTETTPAMHYILVSAVLAGNPFSTAEQRAAEPVLEAAIAEAHASGATVDGSGLIQHAIAAGGLAKNEIDIFGGIQFVGLILTLWWVFRSGRVLLLAAATLGIGVIAALTVSHFVFDRLHVLTLVFCSNLAGVAIDYCVYFCADQFRVASNADKPWQARDALRHIGPAITLSCAAAVLSYALLAVAPFPGLRQAAVFCCVGLIGAYGCVMGWFPRWVLPAPSAPSQRLVARFIRLNNWRDRLFAPRRILPWAALALIVAFGISRMHFEDDVRVLQPSTPELMKQEQVVRDRIGTVPDARFFLVQAESPEALLQAEEKLRPRLDKLITDRKLVGYSAVSSALPSAARQAENHRLLAAHVFASGDPAARGSLGAQFMTELGFDRAAIAARLQAFTASMQTLTSETWLAAPASEPFRHQWLGNIADAGKPPKFASIVTLSDGTDYAALNQAAGGLPEVTFVDRLSQYSAVLRRYRERAMLLVAIAAVASALLLALSYGMRQGALMMLMPSAACLATLSVFGFLGTPLTFFNIVALHLVMGLGMEYAILLQSPNLNSPAVLLSATLAAGLALLAFGLLALSSTPFIHSIGITVSIGVIFGFAFAFCTGRLAERRIS